MKYGNWGALQRDAGLSVLSWVSSRPPNSPGGAPPLWNLSYISRCCCCGPVRHRCQLINTHSLVELAAGIIKLQTGFRPRVPPRGETAGSSACQQLIRATLTSATRLLLHCKLQKSPKRGPRSHQHLSVSRVWEHVWWLDGWATPRSRWEAAEGTVRSSLP